jgi:DNA-binding CsgD family transcriptional regulator
VPAGKAPIGARRDGHDRYSGRSAEGVSRTSGLIGRDREFRVLNDLVDRAGDPAGGALVIRGEPGIGKSALLAAVSAEAAGRGMLVLTAIGVQSEANLPFAGLHQMVRPILHLAAGLPVRQRDALYAAFGMADAEAGELFLIGLATLELISDTAESAPVLLIVDDAQWLDQASCAVLAFVARRLAVDPAVMLAAVREVRDSAFDSSGLREVRLAALSADDAAALLDARAPGLDPVVRTRVLAQAEGNPLALIELSAARWPGPAGADLPSPPMSARLEEAFAARESELPAATRSVLLAAAADDGGVVSEVLRAALLLDGHEVAADAFGPAVAARLVDCDGTHLRFRHPLVRSAIYQSASPSRRQAAHAALAEVLAGHPDRRVWHLAAASAGPDERVASELDGAARRAAGRGAADVAIAALERAALISEDAAVQGGRLLLAAELAFGTGRQGRGAQVLRAAEPLDLPPEERACLSLLRENFVDASWSGATEIGSFVAMADLMTAAGHADLAVESAVTASFRAWFGNPSQEMRTDLVAAAGRLPLADDDPTRLLILAHADPVGQAPAVLERIARLRPDDADPVAMLRAGAAATAVAAHNLALGFLEAAVSGLRAQGRLGLLARALVCQTWAGALAGQGRLAVSAAEEAARLGRETGQLRWAIVAQLAEALIAAERGEFAEAEALAAAAEEELLTMGAHTFLAHVRFVRGRGAVAHQRYEEGLGQLRRAFDPDDIGYLPTVGVLGLSDLVEAAARTGRHEEALAHLRRLEDLAAATSSPLLLAQAAYARPLVADDNHAEALYQVALERDLTGWPCFRNRMLLWYGRWLRRQRRVAESRAPLRAARDGFDVLGFALLAETARQELRASGETSRRRVPEAWDQLTPQELQIARMAAGGLSNREIGQQLFISHRTVGYHLHRIFPKLGITSRSQLHAALLSLTAAAGPPAG